MSEALIVIAFIIVVCVVAYLLMAGTKPAAAVESPRVQPQDWQQVAQDFAAVVGPQPVPKPEPQADGFIRARFLTPHGRLLGEMNLHPKSRKPQLVYEKKGLKHICQCSHQAPDGTWVYRQSGTERP